MRLRSNACSASGGVYDLSRISPLSLCLATSLGGQTEQREEPRAVARELGAELRTRMPDEGGNQHEISMKSACNQHAISMQSACKALVALSLDVERVTVCILLVAHEEQREAQVFLGLLV